MTTIFIPNYNPDLKVFQQGMVFQQYTNIVRNQFQIIELVTEVGFVVDYIEEYIGNGKHEAIFKINYKHTMLLFP